MPTHHGDRLLPNGVMRQYLPNYQGTPTTMGYRDNGGKIQWNKPPFDWDRTDR